MANHYIREGAGGTADGSDWTNAWTDLPATLTRGDTYYIADGAYTNYVFDDAVSGTTYIYIKKATASAHGTETGWDSSYGDGQAVFQNNTEIVWNTQQPYYEIDGVVGEGDGSVTSHGIKVATTQNNENEPCVYAQNGYTFHHWTFKHVEFQGPTAGSSNQTRMFYSNSVAARDSFTFQYCYFHESGKSWITLASANHTNVLIERCYFKNCGSDDAGLHCAGLIYYGDGALAMVVRYNVFENMVGPAGSSAYIEPQGSGATGVDVYGNVFFSSRADETTGLCLMGYTGAEYGAFNFYCNTIYSLNGACGIYAPNATSTINVVDNIWQDCAADPVFTNVDTETTNEKNTGVASFVSAVTGDFHLSSETDAGTDLGASYNTDPDGVTRGSGAVWDLGAYEYVDTSAPYIRIY